MNGKEISVGNVITVLKLHHEFSTLSLFVFEIFSVIVWLRIEGGNFF